MDWVQPGIQTGASGYIQNIRQRNDAAAIVFDFTLSESNHRFIGDPPGYRTADVMVEKFEIGQTSSEAVIQAISDFLIEVDNYEFSTSEKLMLLLLQL